MYLKLAFQRKFLLTNVTLKCFSTVHEHVMSCKSLLITKYPAAYVTFGFLFDSKMNGLDMSAQIFFSWKPLVTVLTFNVTLSVEFWLVFFKCILPFKSQNTNCTMFWGIDCWQSIHAGYLKNIAGVQSCPENKFNVMTTQPLLLKWKSGWQLDFVDFCAKQATEILSRLQWAQITSSISPYHHHHHCTTQIKAIPKIS